MKVNVSTLADATFLGWSWWSNWIDIAIFDYQFQPFLVQMSISRTNAKKFRSVCLTGRYSYRQATTHEIGNLTQMNEE